MIPVDEDRYARFAVSWSALQEIRIVLDAIKIEVEKPDDRANMFKVGMNFICLWIFVQEQIGRIQDIPAGSYMVAEEVKP
jgi:hypothetical protein